MTKGLAFNPSLKQPPHHQTNTLRAETVKSDAQVGQKQQRSVNLF